MAIETAPLPNEDLLRAHYPTGAPVVVRVAFKYGYGPAIVELNRKVYFNDQLRMPPTVLEALQAILLSHCENRYCFVMHLRGLIAQGFSLDDAKRLIETQRLPPTVENGALWEVTLRRLATSAGEARLAQRLYASLRDLHPKAVIDEIGGVVAFASLHQLLLDLYPDEIRIEREPILFETIDCAEELIRYSTRVNQREVPLYTLCCVCKDVRVKSGWTQIESALSDIPADAAFSHGFCESCLERYETDVEAEIKAERESGANE